MSVEILRSFLFFGIISAFSIAPLVNRGFFAECKALNAPLDAPAVQQFGFKYLFKRNERNGYLGFLFAVSGLNTKAQELFAEMRNRYGEDLKCYKRDEIVDLLIEHYHLVSEAEIQRLASTRFGRNCGDTQLLYMKNNSNEPILIWAQLLMSADGTEPNQFALYNMKGELLTEDTIIDKILSLKEDLRTNNQTCLNRNQTSEALDIDDMVLGRRVVRIRMSSSWFDYRFPSAPQFFIGRNTQRSELHDFIDKVRQGSTSLRGLLFSGRSGIGKSSLILKAQDELIKENVIVLPIDSRLCDDITFLFDSVNELLAEARQNPSLASRLTNVQVKGIDSLAETLTEISKALAEEGYLAIMFFDQFEKVFEYPEVTKTIRTLFLQTTERQLSVLFGFAWKSDLWSQPDGFPHAERDDIIRESYPVPQLTPFGQNDTSEILKRLESLSKKR